MIVFAAGLLIYVFMMLVTAYVLGYLEGRNVMPTLAPDEAVFLCFVWPMAIVVVLVGAVSRIMKFTREAGRQK